MTGAFQAGAASVSIEPPLGLAMVGFVRRHEPASSSAGDLEVTALVLAGQGGRAVICGIDTLGIQAPQVDRLRERVAEASGAEPAAVLLNFNHTHCAPAASPGLVTLGGAMDDRAAEGGHYMAAVADRTVDAVRVAVSRLEEARARWSVGRCDEAVNRRERTTDGRVILGWHTEGLVDLDLPVLHVAREDGSSIATVVTYGCHTVAVGPDVLTYSADYPGAMRRAVRDWTGGACVFVQGAGGNVLPRTAFAQDLREAERMGRRLALAALGAAADRPGWPRSYTRHQDGSVTPFHLYRPAPAETPPPVLAASERQARFALQPLPDVEAIRAELDQARAAVQAARARGADPGRINVLRYQEVWATRTLNALEDGTAQTHIAGPVHALRVGDGAFVTGPGEVFTEIGMAVRERSPASVTAYAGYTNGLITYFPTAAEFPFGGYEPAYGNKSFGLPTQVTPEAERTLVHTALATLADVFDTAPPSGGDALQATGAAPPAPPADVARRPV